MSAGETVSAAPSSTVWGPRWPFRSVDVNPGFDSVDFDRSVPEFPSKLHGQHIENRFGTIVAEALDALELPIWGAVRVSVPRALETITTTMRGIILYCP